MSLRYIHLWTIGRYILNKGIHIFQKRSITCIIMIISPDFCSGGMVNIFANLFKSFIQKIHTKSENYFFSKLNQSDNLTLCLKFDGSLLLNLFCHENTISVEPRSPRATTQQHSYAKQTNISGSYTRSFACHLLRFSCSGGLILAFLSIAPGSIPGMGTIHMS